MSLPRTYKGYLTLELLDVFERIPGLRAAHESKEKVTAMRSLMREYRLAPVMWKNQVDEDRAKALIARLRGE